MVQSLKNTFCLCINPVYTYSIGGVVGVLLLGVILLPVIWRYKKNHDEGENEKENDSANSEKEKNNKEEGNDKIISEEENDNTNSESQWSVWISLVLIMSAFDFMSDLNVLISSEWFTQKLFYVSMTILLFQCVPFLLLISKPDVTYKTPYINLFNKLVYTIKYMFTEYKSITEMYYKDNDKRCGEIYGNGDKMGSPYFFVFMVLYLIISWCLLVIIGITEFVIGLSMIIITPTLCLLYVLTSIIITMLFVLHFIFLCSTGFILYCLKLLPHTNICFVKWWWKQWHTKPIFARCLLRSNKDVDDICASKEKYMLTLQLVLIFECIFETFPQFSLQIYNSKQLDSFSPMSIISIAISSFILFSLVYKYFWYFVIDRFCRTGNNKNCYTQIHKIHQSFAEGFAPSPEAKALEKKRKSAAPQPCNVSEPGNNESEDIECDCSILVSCAKSFELCIASCCEKESKSEQKYHNDDQHKKSEPYCKASCDKCLKSCGKCPEPSCCCTAKDIQSFGNHPVTLLIGLGVMLATIVVAFYLIFAESDWLQSEQTHSNNIFDECVHCRVTLGHFAIGVIVEGLMEGLIFRYGKTTFGALFHLIWRYVGIWRLIIGALLFLSDLIQATKHNSSWTDWQCVAYVTINSPNWKMMVYVTTRVLEDSRKWGNDEEYVRSYSILFVVTNIINIMFLFLVICTHIWILIPFGIGTFIVLYRLDTYDAKEQKKMLPYFAIFYYMLGVMLIMYFGLVTIGFYDTGKYAQSLKADLKIFDSMKSCSYNYVIRIILAVI